MELGCLTLSGLFGAVTDVFLAPPGRGCLQVRDCSFWGVGEVPARSHVQLSGLRCNYRCRSKLLGEISVGAMGVLR